MDWLPSEIAERKHYLRGLGLCILSMTEWPQVEIVEVIRRQRTIVVEGFGRPEPLVAIEVLAAEQREAA